MKMKPKSQKQLQKIVDEFNNAHPVGTKCTIILDSGQAKEVTVRSEATIFGGHSAVGWFNEISGCYCIEDKNK